MAHLAFQHSCCTVVLQCSPSLLLTQHTTQPHPVSALHSCCAARPPNRFSCSVPTFPLRQKAQHRECCRSDLAAPNMLLLAQRSHSAGAPGQAYQTKHVHTGMCTRTPPCAKQVAQHSLARPPTLVCCACKPPHLHP